MSKRPSSSHYDPYQQAPLLDVGATAERPQLTREHKRGQEAVGERPTSERATKHYDVNAPIVVQERTATLSLSRLSYGVYFVLTFLMILVVTVVDDQLFRDIKQLHKDQSTAKIIKMGKRGLIFDRNKHVLANDRLTYLASIQPHKFSREQLKEAYRVLPTLTEVEEQGMEKLKGQLHLPKSQRSTYVRLALHVEESLFKTIRERLPMVSLDKQYRRVYPKGDLAGPVLGYMSIYSDQKNGLNGLERAYNEHLKARESSWLSDVDGHGKPFWIGSTQPRLDEQSKSLQLTLDMRIQQITESHLKDAVRASDALGGVAVVMDPHNGDILAMAQAPSYDPNRYFDFDPKNFSNQVITTVYEPGSTMKPLIVAAAIEEGELDEDSILPGHGGVFKLGKHTIRDTHPCQEQSTLEMIQYSSNIGAIHVGKRLGIARIYSYLMKFGFGKKTEIGLSEEQTGTLPNITKIPTKTAEIKAYNWTYGYGLNVTPLQSARAISVIANGGHLVTPRLVKGLLNEQGDLIETFQERPRRSVVGKKAVDIVTKGMVLVTEKGTGTSARVDGYYVAGKSGTARKYVPEIKDYKEGAYLATFVGFVPAENPRFVIYVLINEPQVGSNGGGAVAGPVFSKIAKEILPYLGVPPTRAHSGSRRDRSRQERSRPLLIERDYQPWWSKDRFLTDQSGLEVVPNLKGLDLPELMNKLKELNATVTLKGGSGKVVSQLPEAGELLKERHFVLHLERPRITEHQVSAPSSETDTAVETVGGGDQSASEANSLPDSPPEDLTLPPDAL